MREHSMERPRRRAGPASLTEWLELFQRSPRRIAALKMGGRCAAVMRDRATVPRGLRVINHDWIAWFGERKRAMLRVASTKQGLGAGSEPLRFRSLDG
jgi:hypothetical protein